MEASSDELDEFIVETIATFEPYMYEPLATVNSQLSESEYDVEEEDQQDDCSADDATGVW
jgi:hypothetical protein